MDALLADDDLTEFGLTLSDKAPTLSMESGALRTESGALSVFVAPTPVKKATGPVKICLTMIGKDEEELVYRCFGTLAHLLDAIVVNDNGSCDKMSDKILEFGMEHDIPTRVIHKRWKNFGTNRNYALDGANELTDELDANAQWYYLQYDFDSQLFGPEGQGTRMELDKDSFTDQGVHIWNCWPRGSHWPNIFLVRKDCNPRWFGGAHECLDTKDAKGIAYSTIPKEAGFTLPSHEGARNDVGYRKHRSDYFANVDWMREYPDCPYTTRWMYYCSQSSFHAGMHHECIEWGKKRIAATSGGNPDEPYWSAQYVGLSYLKLFQAKLKELDIKEGDGFQSFFEKLDMETLALRTRGLAYLRKSIDMAPGRRESAHELIWWLRGQGDIGEAYRVGLDVDTHYHNLGSLFQNAYTSNFTFPDELAFICYLHGDLLRAIHIWKRLIKEDLIRNEDQEKRIRGLLETCKQWYTYNGRAEICRKEGRHKMAHDILKASVNPERDVVGRDYKSTEINLKLYDLRRIA